MAIYHDVEQNTAEWHLLRVGIPCSSDFHKIFTPKTKKISTQAPALMYRLLAEWVTGEPVENDSTQWMDRGRELEPQAVAAYEWLTGEKTKPGGFITTDDGMIGCSPDRLIGETGDVELKCPLIHTQIQYALEGIVADEYKTQLQGRLMIHEREYVDVFPYHPRFSIPPLRVYRDEEFVTAMRTVLNIFVETMILKRADLEREFGPFVRPEKPKQIEDPLGITDSDVNAILQSHGWAQ